MSDERMAGLTVEKPTGRLRWLRMSQSSSVVVLQQEWEIVSMHSYGKEREQQLQWRDVPTEVGS